MNLSYRGKCAIAQREAYSRVVYQDGVNFSIGFGQNSPDLTADSTIELADAWALLDETIAEKVATVNKWLGGRVVLQTEFDALVSAHYQAGNKVEAVVRLLAVPDEAMAMLASFNRDSTHFKWKLGLQKRRLAECTLFTLGEYGDLSTVKQYLVNPKEHPLDFTLIPFPPETPDAALPAS